jgi:hypothetical protein
MPDTFFQLHLFRHLQQSPIQDEARHLQFPSQQSLKQLEATELLESSDDDVVFVAAVC